MTDGLQHLDRFIRQGSWPRFSALLNGSILILLLITLAALAYGHSESQGTGLSLRNSYISEFMKMAPHWPWLIVGTFSLAILLCLLAIAFLLRSDHSLWMVLGCLLLAMTAMANFFVAYAPVRRVPQPVTEYQWWTPTWWFTSTAAATPYQNGMADAYSDVHYRATRLAVVTGVLAVLLISLHFSGLPHSRPFARCSWVAVVAMTIFFLMGDHISHNRGLWQRAGLAVFYGWLWAAWNLRVQTPPRPDQLRIY